MRGERVIAKAQNIFLVPKMYYAHQKSDFIFPHMLR